MKKIINRFFYGAFILCSFILLNSSMCTKEEESELLEANAKGYYFIGLTDDNALFGIGHVGFFLVNPDEVRYCSLNANEDRNILSEVVKQTDFNTLYQILVNKNPDFMKLAEAEGMVSQLLAEMQRYNRGFYLEVTKEIYDDMKVSAGINRNYNPLTNNCVHYFRDMLAIANPNAKSVSLTFRYAKTDFDNLQNAVGGIPFSNYKDWLGKIAKLRSAY